MRRLLLLFSKPAIPGRVKTRLAPELGETGAAELHAAFVRDVVSNLSRGDYTLRILWALEPGSPPPSELVPVEAGEVEWRRQAGDDLGDRLFRALRAAAEDAELVGAVGSDHPEIDPVQVEDAFRRLESEDGGLEYGGADVALGPVPDGGYYLIAMRRDAVRRRLFEDIPWSTEEVFERTAERCRELGLRLATLPPGHDVDVAKDLDDLVARLSPSSSGGAERCPATCALLERWGRLDRAGLHKIDKVGS